MEMGFLIEILFVCVFVWVGVQKSINAEPNIEQSDVIQACSS